MGGNQNSQLIKKSLTHQRCQLITLNQVHGNEVIIIDTGNIENAKHPASGYKADGIVTKKKNILLGILTADCAPILFYDPKTATKELVDSVFEMANNRGSVIRVLAYAKSAIRHNMAKDLPKLNMPSLLIWGKQDQVTPPRVAEEFHSLLPNSELHWIDLCGHAPMWEHPKKFSEIVLKWMNKHISS